MEARTVTNLLTSFGFRQKIFEPTRYNNCLDNIFTNFDAHSEYAGVMRTEFADHDAQVIRMSPSGAQVNYKHKVVRPLTLTGFNTMHHKLADVSWDFIDSDIGGDECFERFHQLIVDAFIKSFPEKKVRLKVSHNQGEHWFTQEHRKMREQLLTIRVIYGKYKTDHLLFLKRKLTGEYRKAIRHAKTSHFDKMVLGSDNKS